MPRKPGTTVKVTGVQECLRVLQRVRDSMTGERGTRDVLMAGAREILNLAKYYCPVDTGALRASGRIEVRDNLGPRTLRLWIAFGGKVGFIAPGGEGSQDKGTANKGWKKMKDFAPAHLQGQVVYYAVYVHENMSAAHAAPTQAKFLERAVRESVDRISHVLGREFERVVKAEVESHTGRLPIHAYRDFGRMKIPAPPSDG